MSSSADVIYKSAISQSSNDSKPVLSGEVTFSIECSVNSDGSTVSMLAGVEFTPSTIDFTFIFLSPDPLSGILKWLTGLAGDDSIETAVDEILNKEENGARVLPGVTLRRLRVKLDTSADPVNPKFNSFSFDVEASAGFGQGDGSNTPVFMITYDWSQSKGTTGTLSGALWNGT